MTRSSWMLVAFLSAAAHIVGCPEKDEEDPARPDVADVTDVPPEVVPDVTPEVPAEVVVEATPEVGEVVDVQPEVAPPRDVPEETPAAHLDCEAGLECLEDCGTDQQCHQACMARVCLASQAALAAVNACIARACPTECAGGHTPQCVGCVEARCADQLAACMQATC